MQIVLDWRESQDFVKKPPLMDQHILCLDHATVNVIAGQVSYLLVENRVQDWKENRGFVNPTLQVQVSLFLDAVKENVSAGLLLYLLVDPHVLDQEENLVCVNPRLQKNCHIYLEIVKGIVAATLDLLVFHVDYHVLDMEERRVVFVKSIRQVAFIIDIMEI